MMWSPVKAGLVMMRVRKACISSNICVCEDHEPASIP